MKLTISPEVYQQIPDLVVYYAVIELPENMAPPANTSLTTWWEARGAELAGSEVVTDTAIAPWVALWKRLGISLKNYPPSILGLLKRSASRKPAPRINPIVDCYNALSLQLKLPFGAFDLATIHGDLELRISGGGEAFEALGSTEPENTKANEIVYADGRDVLTRNFIWRQSNVGKVTFATRRWILVCEQLAGYELAEADFTSACNAQLAEQLGISGVTWTRLSNPADTRASNPYRCPAESLVNSL